jgi:hypothetical protein
MKYIPKAEDFIFASPNVSNFAKSFHQNLKNNSK